MSSDDLVDALMERIRRVVREEVEAWLSECSEVEADAPDRSAPEEPEFPKYAVGILT